MLFLKKKRFKPLYKQLLKLRENVQNRKRLLTFKKKKWAKLIEFYKRKLKRYRKFKPQDQNRYLVSKYPSRGNSYQRKYRNTLQASKKFRLFYGDFTRRYLKTQIKLALSKKGKSSTSTRYSLFLEIFERRLDTVLYRSKFSISMRAAQQLVVHGKVLVNNRTVRSKSYMLKQGDLVSIDPKYYALIEENLVKSHLWPIPPKHLLINYKTMQILFGDIETTSFSLAFPFNLNLEKILVNYSKH
jgi:small subunit ribosomal protein S4